MCLEVGAQAIAYNIAAHIIYDTCELVYLSGGQELSFVDKVPVDQSLVLAVEFSGKFVEIGILIYPMAVALNTYARAYYVCLLAGVNYRLEAHVVHVSFFEVIGCGEQQGKSWRVPMVPYLKYSFPLRYA